MTTKTLTRTAFKKGEKRPGQGRPKGSQNKVTKDLKTMILGALDSLGGQKYLEQCGRDPKLAPAYLTLVGKVLPTTLANDKDSPISVTPVFNITLNDGGA